MQIIKYRLCELHLKGDWQPIGVAYLLHDRVHLLVPPASERDLPLSSLEELSQNHVPHLGCRWGTVRRILTTTHLEPTIWLSNAARQRLQKEAIASGNATYVEPRWHLKPGETKPLEIRSGVQKKEAKEDGPSKIAVYWPERSFRKKLTDVLSWSSVSILVFCLYLYHGKLEAFLKPGKVPAEQKIRLNEQEIASRQKELYLLASGRTSVPMWWEQDHPPLDQPFGIYPVMSKIAERRIKLRWHKIDAASEYSVFIQKIPYSQNGYGNSRDVERSYRIRPVDIESNKDERNTVLYLLKPDVKPGLYFWRITATTRKGSIESDGAYFEVAGQQDALFLHRCSKPVSNKNGKF